MQVICEKTCVVRLDGGMRSLVRGNSYEIPTVRIPALVDGGFVRVAEPEPEKAAPVRSPRKRVEPKNLDAAPENK